MIDKHSARKFKFLADQTGEIDDKMGRRQLLWHSGDFVRADRLLKIKFFSIGQYCEVEKNKKPYSPHYRLIL